MLLPILLAAPSAPRTRLVGRATPSVVPSSPPPLDAPLLQACAAGWTAVCPAALSSSREIIHDVFGVATATFEDNLREPAAGFFALTSPLALLMAFLCLVLARADAALACRGLPPLPAEDRSRAGAALAGTCGASAAAIAYAFATGLTVANPAAFGAFAALVAATGLLGARAVPAVDAPLGLYQSDAAELLPFVGERAESADELTSLFYRSSSIVGVIVGLSFLASPLSPIALFDTPEGPATHLLRQELGIFIVFLLAPVQAALYRAAKGGTLADVKLVNVVTGLCCGLLVANGRYQTMAGSAAFAALTPGTEFYDAVQAALGDPLAVGRAQTNTDAAFTVGFVVALFYVAQAARKPADA